MNDQDETDWGLVLLTICAGFLTAGYVGKVPPALPAIRAELALSLIMGGWVMSIFNTTGFILGVAIGRFADRVGYQRLVALSLGFLGVGGLLGGLAKLEVLLLVSRLVEGIGYLGIAIAAPSLIVTITKPVNRRLVLGFWGAWMPIGMAGTMMIAPVVMNMFGWRALWFGLAVPALIFALLIALWPSAAHDSFRAARRTGRVGQNPWRVLRLPGPWLLALSFGLYTLQWTTLMSWLPSYLIEERMLTTTLAAALTALIVVVNAPGNVMAGWCLTHGVPRWVLIAVAGFVMGSSALGIYAVMLPDWLRYACCLIFSSVGGLLPTAVVSGAHLFAPTLSQIGTVNGMFSQGSNAGNFIGPPLLATVVAATGVWESSVWVMVGAAAFVVLIAIGLAPLERRAQAG